MPFAHVTARASLRVRHERPYDFDQQRGLWLYKRVDDDEEYGNIVTNAGRVAIHTFIYGTPAQRTTAGLGTGLNFIGLSNSGTAPAAGDTALTDELTANGLQRVLGTVSLPTGSGAITQIQKEFAYTGGG